MKSDLQQRQISFLMAFSPTNFDVLFSPGMRSYYHSDLFIRQHKRGAPSLSLGFPRASCPPHLLRSWGPRPPGRGRAGPGRHICGGARRTTGRTLTWLRTPGAQPGLGGGAALNAERPDSGRSPGNRGLRPARPALKGTAGFSR